MPHPTFLTITEQVAEHLRGELHRGRWTETIPGLQKLAEELEVNSKTIEYALNLLEAEGLLVGQGAGRKRRIGKGGQKGGPGSGKGVRKEWHVDKVLPRSQKLHFLEENSGPFWVVFYC
jgi:DNA-binding transcriptional regulator YhcF (GntR family)